MERSQQTGLALMIGAAFMLVAFFTSMMRRSYMAVALPVLSALATVSAIAFWIGWTMFTAEEEDEDSDSDEPATS
jgi:lipopolysaccharide export LptBFGC system permease protein LptF